MGHPIRIELTHEGLLDKMDNHYPTRGALNNEVWNIPKGISPKVNVIARLEFELATYDVIV